MTEEDTYEETLALLHSFPDDRVVIASGEDIFNEHGDNLYHGRDLG